MYRLIGTRENINGDNTNKSALFKVMLCFHQAISWSNVHLDLSLHLAYLGRDGLKLVFTTPHTHYLIQNWPLWDDPNLDLLCDWEQIDYFHGKDSTITAGNCFRYCLKHPYQNVTVCYKDPLPAFYIIGWSFVVSIVGWGLKLEGMFYILPDAPLYWGCDYKYLICLYILEITAN